MVGTEIQSFRLPIADLRISDRTNRANSRVLPMKQFTILLSMLAASTQGAFADTVASWQETPPISVGVTGLTVTLTSGADDPKQAQADTPHVVTVTAIQQATPAHGPLRVGDILNSVNGVSLKVVDPRHLLGAQINVSEGGDGKMTYGLLRDGEALQVTIQLDPVGSYSDTFPIDCAKSQWLIDQTAKFILDNGGPEAGITGNLEALFLMSTGEPKYMPAVEKYAVELAGKPCGTSTWMIGYSGLFLGEYYLATGDKRVLPALAQRCDRLASGQWFGGWGHSTIHCGPGYVTGGTLNAAGDQALTTLILARECGLEIDLPTYNNAIVQFSRFAGRGGVPYGDHHPELWWSSNGKNGGLASALTLLPQEKFQGRAKLLALSETDSYFGHEGGHGSCFGNHTWRNVIDALIIDHPAGSWRRHKDQMIWHYELSRMPGGGFRVPHPGGHNPIGNAPHYQTGLLAMALTAHRQQLRITGKPRTKFSVPYEPTEGELAVADNDFQRTDWVDGVVVDIPPHEIAKVFTTIYNADGVPSARSTNASENHPGKQRMPADWYFKIMHHYSPQARVWAANGLSYLGDEAIPSITEALASEDSRLRTAGLNAISAATGWGPGKTKSNITPAMIDQHFLTAIVATLKDESRPMWERRHALMAMSCADKKSIKAYLDVIEPYFCDDEWWLRVAAFKAVEPLIMETETFRGLIPTMIASYDRDTRLPSRRWGATSVFQAAIAKNPAIKDELVAAMAASVDRIKLREGFEQPIDQNNIFETLRYVDMKKNPENAILLLPAIERVYPQLESLPASWTIIGANWGNIGLAKAAMQLKHEGRPFVASMKRIRPNLAARDMNGKQGATLRQALATLDETIEQWEAEHGEVTLD